MPKCRATVVKAAFKRFEGCGYSHCFEGRGLLTGSLLWFSILYQLCFHRSCFTENPLVQGGAGTDTVGGNCRPDMIVN